MGTAVWDLIDEELAAEQRLQKGQALEQDARSMLLGRVPVPDDVAKLVSYLASPGSDHVTGRTVLVDGGIHFS
ncbi:SDR family oxidoreductase [Kineococcus indalonis]|uniref:SDR family oxidoreductase n=1 Tax=Kineococcus indalonis TaxID=2696566 RepID=UPI00196A43D9|nr:SDR family oxidoreductase [Kineococcus indalonis]